jgi:hypothetical protein
MTILAMTIVPFYHQMVKINRYFNNFNKFQQFQQQKIWHGRDCHDKIWIDHFDLENFVILGIVMIRIGSIISTIEHQFGPNGQKSWSYDPPPHLIEAGSTS